MGFSDYRSKLMRYYNEKRFRDALDVAEEAATKFPNYKGKTSFWIACLLSRLGQYDEAVRTLEKAVEMKIWWPVQVLQDPDLEPLGIRPDFETVRAKCERLRLEQPKQAEPDLMVRTPAGDFGTAGWPALMVFHQRYGERPELSSEPWASILSRGILLAVPWSSQVYASDGRCWDNLDIAGKDVEWAFSNLKEKHPVDFGRVIFGGFSQGGALAIYAAMRRLAPCRGFVAAAPSDWVAPEKSAVERKEPSRAFMSILEKGDFRGLRGVIIIGDKDNFLSKIEPLYLIMLKNGLEAKLVVEPGLGHEYPEKFETKLQSAVNFVLGKSEK